MKLEPANIVCPTCGSGNYMRHLIGKNVGYLDMKCINCNSYFNFDELYKRRIGEVLEPKPITNYDSLRAMSMEELAAMKIICRVTAENLDECEKWRFPDGSPDCYSCALDWLRQEAKG